MNQGLPFKNEQFNRLFPFYILLNKKLEIESCGNSLKKIYPHATGSSFTRFCQLTRPQTESIGFSELKSLCNQLVILTINNDSETVLRGQFECLEDSDRLLFIGSPWFNSMEQVIKSGLTLHDFAIHDPLFDLLHVLKTQEISNDDLKEVLQVNQEQKKDLHLLSLAAKANKNGVVFLDDQFRIRWVNTAFETMTGFNQEELNGQLPDQTFFDQDTDFAILSQIQEAGKKKESITTEFWHKRKDGTRFWAHLDSVLIPGPEKDSNWRLNIIADISEQKFQQSEMERLSLVASSNRDGVLFVGLDGKIEWANEGISRLTGFVNADIIGSTPIDLFKGSLTEKAPLKDMIGQFESGLPFNISTIFYRKNGSYFWGRSKGQAIKDKKGRTQRYFCIIEDISEEKASEEKLKVLSQIAENNINAVVIADKDGKISWANRSFTQMTGYELKEVTGKSPGSILQGPETDKKTSNQLRKQIREGKPFSAEILNYTKAGTKYWVRIQGQPIVNEKDEITGYFALEENITDKKEAELRFRNALEKIGDNVWEHNFETGKTFFSKSSNNLLGQELKVFSNAQKLWWESIHPEDLPILVDNDKKYRNGEIDSHRLEYRLIHKDGTIKWVLDRGVVIKKDSTGLPLLITGTHTDITSTKQTATELAIRVKQFRSLSENIPGVIYEYEFRPDGTEGIRYMSPAIETIFGIPAEEYIRNHEKLIHPDDKYRIAKKNKLSKETLGNYFDESRLIVPGRGIVWRSVSSSFSYQTEDGTRVFTGFMLDITERKSAEEKLESQKNFYEEILNNLPADVAVFNNQHEYLFVNPQGIKDAALRKWIIGKRDEDYCTLRDKPLSIAAERRKLFNKMLDNKKTDEWVEKGINPDGTANYLLRRWHPVVDKNGKINLVIGYGLDITERKMLEEELIRSREHAEMLARAKEQFLANMSHEIRTPMNAIIGMGNQLSRSQLSTQQQFYLNTINTAAENLLVIINDILDLSKIEAGKLSLEKIGFEPVKVVNNAIEVMRHKAEEKGLRLTAVLNESQLSPVLIGDPFRINQVLLNLISNAIKFTEKGSVNLSCRVIAETKETQTLQCQVIDTGMGMDQVFIDRLFEKFSQENDSVSRQFGGTGLGMSICKELVELMGGTIEVKSKKGQGSRFTITQEFKKGTYQDLPAVVNTQITGDFLKNKKILVADDNEMNRLVASIILENYGASVLESDNGRSTLEAINTHLPDLVLMDIQMPELNGYETTRLLRKLGNTIPVIALTANAIKGESDKCLEAGMNDYISKPFKEDEFLKTIARWLKTDITMKSETEETVPSMYNLESLRDISRGNEAFVQKMIRIFCEQTPLMVKEMQAAWEEKNLALMGAIAHKIKPSIDNLNIHSLKQVIRDIETDGKEQKESENLKDLLDQTRKIIAAVVSDMQINVIEPSSKP
jgi:two-component system, sensor histidine kinase